ncbi:MAG TPA: hypothetical protein VG916_04705, partial [Gemmatimonadaceae bacterium]|nr:hypothetical protein [Gemmatimonadaceae bacterium]
DSAGGRGGRGGRGAIAPDTTGGGGGGGDDAGADDNTQTVQAKFGRTTDVMNVFFSPTPEQLRLVKSLPADLQKQADRLEKLVKERIPAIEKALQDAGVTVRNP